MSDVHRTIEAVWKRESTRLIAAIARVTRDIGVAEEPAQDPPYVFVKTTIRIWQLAHLRFSHRKADLMRPAQVAVCSGHPTKAIQGSRGTSRDHLDN